MFKIEVTKDGSPTVYSELFKTTFHSFHGAIRESEHVFIQNGFRRAQELFDTVNILEIGFGTGLNATLTLKEILNSATKANYTGIEKYPLPAEIYSNLNYFENSVELSDHHLKLHTLPWEQKNQVNDRFSFVKHKADVLTFSFSGHFNLIYFDAFAPSSQEELWNKSVFEKMYSMLEPGGILVTFCAKGEVKRTLKSIGFTVEALPGAPGKREMTRATR